MESVARPLRALESAVKWFARATEVALLHVTCSADLRRAALKLCAAGVEFHPDNRSPLLVLEDAHKRSDDGWRVRAQRMVEQWEGRVRVLAEQGIELGSMSGQHPASPNALGAFGGWLHLLAGAVRAPLDGLVIVLAPTVVEDAARFDEELLELMRRPELATVRWVVLELSEAPLARVHDELGDRAMRCACVRDAKSAAHDLRQMVSSVDPEMPGPAGAGAAWPRGVIPPPRPGAPERATPEQQALVDAALESAGVSPGLAGPDGARMQQRMMAAALSLKEGDGPRALEHQAEARAIAARAGASREALIQHAVLAGYHLSLGQPDAARADYAAVADQAGSLGLPLEEAQAQLALAVIDAREGRLSDAATHYGAAASAAERANATGLAIESWRLAGQLAAESGIEERSAECFERAIALAETSEPDVAKTSSAPEAARQLAAILRARGHDAQAESLEHTANRLEEGMPRSVEALL